MIHIQQLGNFMYVIVFANLGIFKLESLLKCYLILIHKRSHFEKFFFKILTVIELFIAIFIRAGVLAMATAVAAVSPMLAPK